MTVKDELLIYWICCAVVIVFLVRHFFSAASCLIERLGALSMIAIPHVAQFFMHFR